MALRLLSLRALTAEGMLIDADVVQGSAADKAGRDLFVVGPDGTAQKRDVEVVRSIGTRSVVRGQVANGERVITDGAQRVTQGTRVEDRNAPQRVSSAN